MCFFKHFFVQEHVLFLQSRPTSHSHAVIPKICLLSTVGLSPASAKGLVPCSRALCVSHCSMYVIIISPTLAALERWTGRGCLQCMQLCGVNAKVSQRKDRVKVLCKLTAKTKPKNKWNICFGLPDLVFWHFGLRWAGLNISQAFPDDHTVGG